MHHKRFVEIIGHWLTEKLKGKDNFLRNLAPLAHKWSSNSWSNTLVDTRH